MVAPRPVIRDVHARFALTRGLDQGAVGVEDGTVEEAVALLGPDPHSGFVDGVDERLDARGREAAAKVASGGGVGDAASAQGIEEGCVVAAEFDLLQAGAVAQGVVGDVEDVVGFVIRQMQLEEMEAFVDRLDQAHTPGQGMERSDSAAADGLCFVGDFVVNVAGRKLGCRCNRIV